VTLKSAVTDASYQSSAGGQLKYCSKANIA